MFLLGKGGQAFLSLRMALGARVICQGMWHVLMTSALAGPQWLCGGQGAGPPLESPPNVTLQCVTSSTPVPCPCPQVYWKAQESRWRGSATGCGAGPDLRLGRATPAVGAWWGVRGTEGTQDVPCSTHRGSPTPSHSSAARKTCAQKGRSYSTGES